MSSKIIQSLLLYIFFLLLSCGENNNIQGYKMSEYMEGIDCIVVRNELQTYKDPFLNFQLDIPINWEVQVDKNDSLYGVLIIDTASFRVNYKDFQSIVITKYTQKVKELKDYFISEIELMKNEKGYEIIKLGKLENESLNSYWVCYQTIIEPDRFHNLTIYTTDSSENLFLIQTTIYMHNDYESKFCRLKQIIKEFNSNLLVI